MKKPKFLGYQYVPDENGDASQAWEFLFDKVSKLRQERDKKMQLQSTQNPVYTVSTLSSLQSLPTISAPERSQS